MTLLDNPEVLEAIDKRTQGAVSGIGRTSGDRALEIFSMCRLSWFQARSQVNFFIVSATVQKWKIETVQK